MFTCTKTQYDKRGAQSVVNQRTQGRSRQRHNRPAYLRAYHCSVCNHWHVTHKRQSDIS